MGKSGGGWRAIGYSLKLSWKVGPWKMWKALRSKNTCKTCAVGMGGQLGGMVNEGGYFPEVCKKSFQAMASDLQGALPDDFFQQHSIQQLRAMTPRMLEQSGRLTRPMVLRKGATHYEPIEWDAAFDSIAAGLKQAGPQRSFYYASGRSSNEAGFLLQLLARLAGTNYVNNCSYYCHQASGVGLGTSIGTGAGTVRLEDLHECDLYILIGANPASNHPRLMRTLMEIRRRGGEVIVVNTLKEAGLENFKVPSDVRSLLFGSKIASMYVQPHIGGDLALLTGIAKWLLETNAHDADFIAQHTEGFDDFASRVESTTWEEIVTSSGVDRETIELVASKYASAENAVVAWAMGITHHLHGTDNVRSIVNMLLLRGMVGRRGAGVMPIRGHSNVQGMGSVGVTPTLKKGIIRRFEEHLGITPPSSPGYDTMACMDAAERGEMDAALCLGGNLYHSNPAMERAANVLGKLKQNTYLTTTLNTGHAWGTAAEETILLPVLPRDEEPQPTTQESMFSYVRYSEGGASRHEGPRSEVSILTAIGSRLLGPESPVDWSRFESHQAVRELIAELIPEYEAMKTIDQNKEEFHVPGRAVDDYHFPTETGKAKFHALGIPQPSTNGSTAETLKLMTLRSEGQFNTVVYEEEDIYRGQTRRDVILLSEEDMSRLGLQTDQRVRVKSSEGEMRNILARPFAIRSGNAMMYYPEANILVPASVDPDSKTPAFKNVAITITPEGA